MNDLYIPCRWMVRSDLKNVVGHSDNTIWNNDLVLRFLRQTNCIGLVVCGNSNRDVILAVAFYSLHLKQFRIEDLFGWEPAKVAIINKLKSKLSTKHPRKKISFDICEQSLEGDCLFFKSHGFVATKVSRNACMFHGDDTIHMEYSIAKESPQKVMAQ